MKKSGKLFLVLRTLASMLMFLLFLAAFAFGIESLSVVFVTQLGPNIASLIASFSIGTLVAVLLILLSAVFLGRFYCAAFCPLGILQDIIGAILPRQCKKEKDWRITRYFIGIVVLALLIGGWTIGLRLLDPFSNFGAIASGLLVTPLTYLHNLFYREQMLVMREVSVWTLFAGLVPLAILIVLVWWKSRIYCTAICPVGTLLGVCSRHSVVRLVIGAKCVKCGKCVDICPAGCIDIADGQLDNERCLRCMKCLKICPLNEIKFAVPGQKKNTKPDEKLRNLMFFGFSAIVLAVFGGGVGYFKRRSSPGEPAKKLIYPPGAGSRQRFDASCTGCNLCVNHCLGNVIVPALSRVKTVSVKYDRGMCEFNCKRCIEVCPTGALMNLNLKAKQRTRIGMAEFKPNLCVAVLSRIDCGACAEHCPTGALRMLLTDGIRIPVLNRDLCIGCGSCEYPCPVRPEKAIQVTPVNLQLLATDPDEFFRPAEAEEINDDWLI